MNDDVAFFLFLSPCNVNVVNIVYSTKEICKIAFTQCILYMESRGSFRAEQKIIPAFGELTLLLVLWCGSEPMRKAHFQWLNWLQFCGLMRSIYFQSVECLLSQFMCFRAFSPRYGPKFSVVIHIIGP